MRSIPVLSSTRHLKVVAHAYLGENRFVLFSSIYSVTKVSHFKYFDCHGFLVANNFIKNDYGIHLL